MQRFEHVVRTFLTPRKVQNGAFETLRRGKLGLELDVRNVSLQKNVRRSKQGENENKGMCFAAVYVYILFIMYQAGGGSGNVGNGR